jgi:hypothetical protein
MNQEHSPPSLHAKAISVSMPVIGLADVGGTAFSTICFSFQSVSTCLFLSQLSLLSISANLFALNCL